MSMTDPVADMLSRIRNASSAAHDEVVIPASKIKESIAKILADEGFVQSYETSREETHANIKIRLRYSVDRESAIAGISRVSKPGRRVYKGARELPRVLGGLGIAIISTSQGVMTDRQARRVGVGGEVLAHVW